MVMHDGSRGYQPDPEVQKKLTQVREIMSDLHDRGLISGYSWIVGIATPDLADDQVCYNTCCAAHACDFLSPEVVLRSPNPDIREYATRQFAAIMGELIDLSEDSPYSAFRSPLGAYVPPSEN